MRSQLLALASQRIDTWYADASHLEDPKERDGVTFRLSKEDKACGGDGVPLTFLEFDVDDARAVDVFNVLADVQKQPTWDTHCGKMTLLGDLPEAQARGYAGLFLASPLPSREAYEWQVAGANFTSEEFWIVFSTLQNDNLKQRKVPEPGSVQMQNCLGAYRITTNAKGGAHVINTQQVNSHPWPMTARSIANMAWGDSVDFAVALRSAAQQQAKLGWNATQTVLPPWMLQEQSCAAPHADTDLRDSLIRRAADALQQDPGQERSHKKLPDGEDLRIWQRPAVCGGLGVAPAQLPIWRVEFRVPKAEPLEVFNVLVAKGKEASWNSRVQRTNISGFDGAARAVHESIAPPRILDKVWDDREMWEWQAISRDVANNTYLVALSSAAEPFSPSFGRSTMKAVQCLTAYEASPSPGGGTLVRMTSHVNPNVGFLSRIAFLWEQAAQQMLEEFAAALSSQAQFFAAARRHGGPVSGEDVAVLQMLTPAPPGQNKSVSVTDVLQAWDVDQPRVFASLDLPTVLDAPEWTSDDFATRAAQVQRMFKLFRHNATQAESEPFLEGPAQDSTQVQLQGQALATLQMRFLQAFAKLDCESGPTLPDIDGDKPASGVPIMIVVGISAAVIGALLIVCGVCFWKRWRRYRRNRAAAAIAAMLLSECSAPSVVAEQRVKSSGSHENAHTALAAGRQESSGHV